MEFQNTSCDMQDNQMELTANLDIKEEVHQDITIDIKPENHENDSNDNPFDDVQVEIKQEFITPNLEQSKELSLSSICKEPEILDTVLQLQNEINEAILPNNDDDIKIESQEEIVGYDYPSVDEGSMDSADAQALNNVEACLQDDIEIKNENDMYEVRLLPISFLILL